MDLTNQINSCSNLELEYQKLLCSFNNSMRDLEYTTYGERIPYLNEVFEFLRLREDKYKPEKNNFKKIQTDISEEMRAILIDWQVEVHLKFKLKPITLYQTVNLIDRFLSKNLVHRRKLQLVGVSSLMIACKLEEIYPPEIGDFIYITDNAYTRKEVVEMEGSIITSLKFELCSTPAYVFLQKYLQISNVDTITSYLAQYFIDECLLNYEIMAVHSQHMLACSALYLANKFRRTKDEAWSENLIIETQFQEIDLRKCAKAICITLKKSHNSNLKAIKKKYSHKEFGEVSKQPEQNCNN